MISGRPRSLGNKHVRQSIWKQVIDGGVSPSADTCGGPAGTAGTWRAPRGRGRHCGDAAGIAGAWQALQGCGGMLLWGRSLSVCARVGGRMNGNKLSLRGSGSQLRCFFLNEITKLKIHNEWKHPESKRGETHSPKAPARRGLVPVPRGPVQTGRGGPDGQGPGSYHRPNRGQALGQGWLLGWALCAPKEGPSQAPPALPRMGHPGRVRNQTAVLSGPALLPLPSKLQITEELEFVLIFAHAARLKAQGADRYCIRPHGEPCMAL